LIVTVTVIDRTALIERVMSQAEEDARSIWQKMRPSGKQTGAHGSQIQPYWTAVSTFLSPGPVTIISTRYRLSIRYDPEHN